MIRSDINALTSFGIRLLAGLDFLWLAYIQLGRIRLSPRAQADLEVRSKGDRDAAKGIRFGDNPTARQSAATRSPPGSEPVPEVV